MNNKLKSTYFGMYLEVFLNETPVTLLGWARYT